VTVATPTPNGSGPFTFAIVTPPDAAGGAATIDPSTGEISFTPVAGVSGRFTTTYAVTDADGHVSDPIEVTFVIAPDGAPSGSDPVTATAVGTAPVTLQAVAPVGTGPFTYRIATPAPPEQGTATIDPATGVITFTAAAGFVGTATFTYEVVDAEGVVSAPVAASVEVSAPPVAPDPGPSGPTSATGALAAPLPTEPSSGGSRRLAFTGARSGLLVMIGSLLLGFGAALVGFGAWRRRIQGRLGSG
jgi:hypothetical protein